MFALLDLLVFMVYIRLFEFLDELYVLVCACMVESLEVYLPHLLTGFVCIKQNNKV